MRQTRSMASLLASRQPVGEEEGEWWGREGEEMSPPTQLLLARAGDWCEGGREEEAGTLPSLPWAAAVSEEALGLAESWRR